MNVIYLGRFFPPNLSKTVIEKSKGTINFSNHKFESVLLDGLTKQDINLEIVTVPGIDSYPTFYKDCFVSGEQFYINGVRAKSISFCNIIILNKIWIVLSLFIQLIQLIKKYKSKDVIYIIMNTASLNSMLGLSLFNFLFRKRLKMCLILPDAPQYISVLTKQSIIKGFFISIMNKFTLFLMNEFHSFVLLTDEMKNVIPWKNKPYIVMEGIVSDKFNKKADFDLCENSDRKILLYTGTLHKTFGIINLLDAFQAIDNPSVELWICGSGDSSEEIQSRVKQDNRIKFFGLVSVDESVKLQSKATILVNPRTSEGEFTKYSFPSKIMEYMSSGKPIIMNKLPGIPSEYFSHAFITDDDRVLSFKKTIENVIALPYSELLNKGFHARKFVLEHKNSIVQSERIISLINKL